MYIPCIYIIYLMNIHGTCKSQGYPLNKPSLVQMGLFSTFFLMICLWYSKYIQWIYLVNHKHIIIKEVLNKPICTGLGISRRCAWDLHIHGIYLFPCQPSSPGYVVAGRSSLSAGAKSRGLSILFFKRNYIWLLDCYLLDTAWYNLGNAQTQTTLEPMATQTPE